jgi:hypothetical protein
VQVSSELKSFTSNLDPEGSVCQRKPQLDCEALCSPNFAVVYFISFVGSKHLHDPRTYHHSYPQRAALTYQETWLSKAFFLSDVSSFILQGAGESMLSLGLFHFYSYRS